MPTATPDDTRDLHTRAAVTAREVVKDYGAGEASVTALDRVSIAFASGTFTAIMGPSGSGKSTLMHCLAGLDTVTSGSVVLGDTEIVGLGDKQLTLLRRQRVGSCFRRSTCCPR